MSDKKKIAFVCIGKIQNGNLHVASWIESITEAIGKDWDICFVLERYNIDPVISGGKVSLANKEYEAYQFTASSELSVLENELQVIFTKAKSAIVQCFGTEFLFSLATLNVCKGMGILNRSVIFMQGLCEACYLHYSEGVPESIRRLKLPKNVLIHDDILSKERELKQKMQIEKTIIEKTSNIIGRTRMDRAFTYLYNPQIHYYQCNDFMRPTFYEGKWEYENCAKHTIFVSQYYYPLKGFHYLLHAVHLLKDKYPDIVIYAAGYNPIGNPERISYRDNSYMVYLKHLIKKYDLFKNVVFTGQLTVEQMKERYLQANVFVMPSTIENSPNSLAEAMLLGVPSIATDVGGVLDFAKVDDEAFIYNPSAYYMLANYIDRIFSDSDLATQLGKNAKKRAENEYSVENNNQRINSIYQSIIEDR